VLAVEQDAARAGGMEPRQQGEGGGLARSVRPDQRMYGAALDPQTDILDGDKPLDDLVRPRVSRMMSSAGGALTGLVTGSVTCSVACSVACSIAC